MPRHFHREKAPATPPAAAPRPVLEMVQLPIFRVHYRRLEEYLAKVYRMEDFDFLRATGPGPGLVPEYAVSPALPPRLDAARQAEAIRAGRADPERESNPQRAVHRRLHPTRQVHNRHPARAGDHRPVPLSVAADRDAGIRRVPYLPACASRRQDVYTHCRRDRHPGACRAAATEMRPERAQMEAVKRVSSSPSTGFSAGPTTPCRRAMMRPA